MDGSRVESWEITRDPPPPPSSMKEDPKDLCAYCIPGGIFN